MVTLQVPVVQNIPSVPIQNLSPVGPQNAGTHPSTQSIPPHNSNEAMMSGITSLYTQTVAPGSQQELSGNQIPNRPQPGIAIVYPQSVEQATESSNATRAPLPKVSATIKFPSLSERSNGNEFSSVSAL